MDIFFMPLLWKIPHKIRANSLTVVAIDVDVFCILQFGKTAGVPNKSTF